MSDDLIANSWLRGNRTSVFAKAIGAALVLVPIAALLGLLDLDVSAKFLWFLSAIGVGAVAAGYFLSENARRFAGVMFSVFVGGAAQLWLTEPLWFPALTFSGGEALVPYMLALIVLQVAVAVVTIWQTGKFANISTLLAGFGPVRLILFAILTGAFSVSLLGYMTYGGLSAYLKHAVAASAVVGINFLSLAALASLPPPFEKHRGFSILVPMQVAFFASALMAWFAFQGMSHVEDELAYLFQARSIADLAWTAAAPPDGALPGLEYYLLDVQEGRWLAVTSPGWPIALAFGVAFSVPWLANPVLAGITVYLAHSVTWRLTYERRKADIVALLMCTSPWFLAAGASLMPHMTSLAFALLSWRLLLLTRPQGSRYVQMAFLAGLAMGWVFLTRQMDGLILGTLTGLWLLTRPRPNYRAQRVIFYALGCILTGLLYFLYNWIITGDPMAAPLAEYTKDLWGEGANVYGFGPDAGPAESWGVLDYAQGHSFGEALLNTQHNLFMMAFEAVGWGLGALAGLWAMLLWAKPQRSDVLMLIVAVAIIVAMGGYWANGGFYVGARYWFPLYLPVLILSASGILAAFGRLEAHGLRTGSLSIAIFCLAMFSLFVFTPWRGVTKYYGYGNVSAEFKSAAQKANLGNALVFVGDETDPGAALVLNLPHLPDHKPIFLMDKGDESNAAAIAAYPDRPVVYFVDGAFTNSR